MNKAEERACQYTGYCKNQSYSDFLKGYQQAEKDLELSWEDLKMIDEISDQVYAECDVDAFDEKVYYQEILKRFKNLKK